MLHSHSESAYPHALPVPLSVPQSPGDKRHLIVLLRVIGAAPIAGRHSFRNRGADKDSCKAWAERSSREGIRAIAPYRHAMPCHTLLPCPNKSPSSNTRYSTRFPYSLCSITTHAVLVIVSAITMMMVFQYPCRSILRSPVLNCLPLPPPSLVQGCCAFVHRQQDFKTPRAERPHQTPRNSSGPATAMLRTAAVRALCMPAAIRTSSPVPLTWCPSIPRGGVRHLSGSAIAAAGAGGGGGGQAASNQPEKDPAAPGSAESVAAVRELQRLLGARVVGHSDVKECLLLGLLAREHVYLQGDPGSAKTFVAEATAEATGLSMFSLQFHRDTRLQDLIGAASYHCLNGPDGAEGNRTLDLHPCLV